MNGSSNTNAFYLLSVIGFTIALLGTLIGVLRLEADIQTKGFFAMSYLFSIFATFTLSKVIRDRAEERSRAR
jgi:hypothetical protein